MSPLVNGLTMVVGRIFSKKSTIEASCAFSAYSTTFSDFNDVGSIFKPCPGLIILATIIPTINASVENVRK
ncbi:hypothetical protein D3C75_1117160 [compost metagenome]